MTPGKLTHLAQNFLQPRFGGLIVQGGVTSGLLNAIVVAFIEGVLLEDLGDASNVTAERMLLRSANRVLKDVDGTEVDVVVVVVGRVVLRVCIVFDPFDSPWKPASLPKVATDSAPAAGPSPQATPPRSTTAPSPC